jgi:hypothetical protein
MRTALPARIVFALLGWLAVLLPGHAIAQTADALAAADRLITVQNLDATMMDMAVNVSAQLPGATEGHKKSFIAEMTSKDFLNRYKGFVRVAFAKHLSVEEMNALSDFYSKPIAASAMKKMGATMAEVMPFIQAEIPGIVARVMKAP